MADAFGAILGIGATLGALFGWLNHLYVCFTLGKTGFLIAGAIFFPIGVIHGWGLFFGIW